MSQKYYSIPVILRIPADSYEDAVSTAIAFNNQLGNTDMLFDDCGIKGEVETDFEYDNDGQRVLYLHAENDPMEEDE